MINKSAADDVRPFSDLRPDVVLDAAASVGFEGDGRLFALNSYENRVYQLGRGAEGPVVLKFYRPGRWTERQIEEEHAFAAELAEAELQVAAPIAVAGETLFRYGEFRFSIFRWMHGRAPELDAPGARQMLGRSLARIHQIGSLRPFRARPRLSIERLGVAAREHVLMSSLLPAALADQYERVSGELLARIRRVFDATGNVHYIRVHGDCHLGNLLWNERGPVFVDLDDCMMGPRIQDLWMLLSGPPMEQQRQWDELLEGYQQFADFDFLELNLIEALRGLRMLHHAAWIAQRWNDPAFPKAFPWFGSVRYWENHLNDLMEQLAAIDDPPLLQR